MNNRIDGIEDVTVGHRSYVVRAGCKGIRKQARPARVEQSAVPRDGAPFCIHELSGSAQWKALLAALRALPADISVEAMCVGYKTILARLMAIPATEVESEFLRECRAAKGVLRC